MKQYPAFKQLLDAKIGAEFITQTLVRSLENRMELFKRWYRETGEAGEIYPSQGLLKTDYDYLDYLGKTLLEEKELWEVLKVRHYILEIFNHPQRLECALEVEKAGFQAPAAIKSNVMDYARESGLALSVGDLGAIVTGTDGERVGRRDLLACGPFVKLGKYARIPFSSGAMPDVFGAPAALATMAMSHALTCIPRNGIFSDIKRQADLVSATIEWMKTEPLLEGREDRNHLVRVWKRHLVGVIEPEGDNGLKRAAALYAAGVRAFRIYSPEPGRDAQRLVKQLRREYDDKIEVFAGQVASVTQGQQLAAAGADGLYVGIGGGGRCITAQRSSSVVDWPNLIWQMRGKVSVPVMVEGGASDHVGTTLLLGASGVGVSRIAAGGTIESPGGLLYLVDKEGVWFKPYGGEASARTKFHDHIILALGIPAFVEGETTKAIKSFIPHIKPTVAANVYFLLEDVILSLVFRGVHSIGELQAIEPSPLRRISLSGSFQQRTH